MYAGLFHVELPGTGLHLALGLMSVPDDQAAALLVAQLFVGLDVGSHLGFDGRLQHALGAFLHNPVQSAF